MTASTASSLEALAILRNDLNAREARVTERETRARNWQLVAAARDSELEREAAALKSREETLGQREAQLRQKEMELADREFAMTQRLIRQQEEHDRVASEARAEILRLKSQLLGAL